MLFQNDGFDPDAPADPPEKTGSARFFEILQGVCVALFQLNLLFLMSCIPIITIPPALCAMHCVVGRMLQNLSGRCSHYYWTAFRQLWKQAYGAFLATALPLVCAGYGALFYLRGAAEAPVLLLPFLVCSTVFLAAMLSSPYLYGLLGLGRPLREALRPALILGLSRPWRAVLAALCSYGSFLVAALAFPLSLSYLVLIGFSLPCLLASFLIRNVLPQYIHKEATDHAE